MIVENEKGLVRPVNPKVHGVGKSNHNMVDRPMIFQAKPPRSRTMSKTVAGQVTNWLLTSPKIKS